MIKNQTYKSLALSFFITTIWTIAAFFIYFYEEPGWFNGWDTLIYFLVSCWIAAGIGIIAVLLSLLKRFMANEFFISSLICSTILNIYCITIFLILSFQGLLHSNIFTMPDFISNLIVSVLGLIALKRIGIKLNNKPSANSW